MQFTTSTFIKGHTSENKTKFANDEQRKENRDKAGMDNRGTVESSTISRLMGEQQKGRGIYRTIQDSNSGASESTAITIEEREELESRGLNPGWKRFKFERQLTE